MSGQDTRLSSLLPTRCGSRRKDFPADCSILTDAGVLGVPTVRRRASGCQIGGGKDAPERCRLPRTAAWSEFRRDGGDLPDAIVYRDNRGILTQWRVLQLHGLARNGTGRGQGLALLVRFALMRQAAF